MAIGKKTGGRTKGVPNKKAAIVERMEAIVSKAQITPLEYMLGILNDPDSEPRDKAWAANAAAPYVHPKLANVDIGNKNGEAFRVMLDAADGGII